MKVRTVGKYESKREVVDYTLDDFGGDLGEIAKVAIKASKGRPHGAEAIARQLINESAAFLRSCGLPDAPVILHDGEFTGRWERFDGPLPATESELRALGWSRITDLVTYVKLCGYAEDSGPYLAARMIRLANTMLAKLATDPAGACDAALELGMFAERARSYGKRDAPKHKKRKKRRKAWAVAYASGKTTPAENGAVTVMDGEWLVELSQDQRLEATHNESGRKDSIAWETFVRHYSK